MAIKQYFCLQTPSEQKLFYTGVGHAAPMFTADMEQALIFPTAGSVEDYKVQMERIYRGMDEDNPLQYLVTQPCYIDMEGNEPW